LLHKGAVLLRIFFRLRLLDRRPVALRQSGELSAADSRASGTISPARAVPIPLPAIAVWPRLPLPLTLALALSLTFSFALPLAFTLALPLALAVAGHGCFGVQARLGQSQSGLCLGQSLSGCGGARLCRRPLPGRRLGRSICQVALRRFQR